MSSSSRDHDHTAGVALERPRRVQLSRTKGWRMPPNTVKVDRGSSFGNPFRLTDVQGDAARAVAAFRSWASSEAYQQAAIRMLGGKNLACWCKLGAPCHADVLLELANPPSSAEPMPGESSRDEKQSLPNQQGEVR